MQDAQNVIVCENLSFKYKNSEVLHNINFEVKHGGIVGLLGKNGAGKSTIINILMGFLRPNAGKCSVFGHPSFSIPPHVRADIGLVHEGFTQYDFMSVEQIEKYYRAYYARWDRDLYYDLTSRLNVPKTRKISKLSCGQRSQVTLGLVLAQRPELLILDDFSMGLDVGYRRLFLEFLRDFVDSYKTTVLLTSHIISELENFIDEAVILKEGKIISKDEKTSLLNNFYSYTLPLEEAKHLKKDEVILNIEYDKRKVFIFTFASPNAFRDYLSKRQTPPSTIKKITQNDMNLEDAFIGLTGRY
ncbi:MAG: ABC transporter ATP-binding protein [Campylobacteraceae bacterium]|jgi:ABC-2 type transport system ATP-binding protein|nr:ABC transporter ATP-binding protein [Campylobacteraceae bacterium]